MSGNQRLKQNTVQKKEALSDSDVEIPIPLKEFGGMVLRYENEACDYITEKVKKDAEIRVQADQIIYLERFLDKTISEKDNLLKKLSEKESKKALSTSTFNDLLQKSCMKKEQLLKNIDKMIEDEVKIRASNINALYEKKYGNKLYADR